MQIYLGIQIRLILFYELTRRIYEHIERYIPETFAFCRREGTVRIYISDNEVVSDALRRLKSRLKIFEITRSAFPISLSAKS